MRLPMSVFAVVAISAVTRIAGAEDPSDFAEVRDPNEPLALPAAEDGHSGHVLIGATGGLAVPSTALVPRIPELGELTAGGGGKLSVGIGLGRYLTLRARGGVAYMPGTPATCPTCSALSADVGGDLLYHLVQGLAFDPYVGLGMAYRHTSITLPTGTRTFSGFDVARITLGGDFYPSPVFGFGPVLETDIGVRGEVAYGMFHAGIRLVFDPLRSGVTSEPPTATAKF